MIDPKTLFPMVKKLLPNESDQDIMQGIQEFMKIHPDLSNDEALQALVQALKQMQPPQQAPQQPPQAAAPAQPFGQGMLGALGAK